MEKQHPILTDGEIVELYWQRNEDAIKETDRKYKPYLMTVAHNIIHNRLDCEECLNDTYVSAWNAMPPSRPAVLKAFLTTIMRRVAVNRYHASHCKKRIPSEMTVSLSDLGEVASDGSTAEEFDAERLGALISSYLHTLSQRQRYIFIGRYFMADPIDVIARELRVSHSTVKKELATIRKGLKKALESEGYSI